MVLIRNELLSTGECRKLEPRYKLSYVVAKVLEKNRYILEDIKGIQVSQKGPMSNQ